MDLRINYYERHSVNNSESGEKKIQADYLFSRLEKLNLKRDSRVLDVATGIGIFGKALIEKYKSNVYGVDLSPEAVRLSKKNGIKSIISDLDKPWPYKDSFFDLILSVQTIEHVYNPDHFLDESKRVLKKNGTLIITTPNLACWFNRIIFFFGYQPFFTEVSTIDKTVGLGFTRKLSENRETLGHLRVFTLKALEDILELHGFSIQKRIGGEVGYIPKYMKFIDRFFANFPSLSTDLIIIATKK